MSKNLKLLFSKTKSTTDFPNDKKGRHRLFCLSVNEFSPENFIGFMLTDDYRKYPTKRKADFIYKTLINRSSGEWERYGELLADANISGKSERDSKAMASPTSGLPRTFGEKVEKWGVAGAVWHKLAKDGTKPAADVFDYYWKDLQSNLSDTNGRLQSIKGDIMRRPEINLRLMLLRQDLIATGWAPDELGLW